MTDSVAFGNVYHVRHTVYDTQKVSRQILYNCLSVIDGPVTWETNLVGASDQFWTGVDRKAKQVIEANGEEKLQQLLEQHQKFPKDILSKNPGLSTWWNFNSNHSGRYPNQADLKRYIRERIADSLNAHLYGEGIVNNPKGCVIQLSDPVKYITQRVAGLPSFTERLKTVRQLSQNGLNLAVWVLLPSLLP